MDEIKEILRQAADIAKVLPENLQEVGFTRALEMLLGEKARGSEVESGLGGGRGGGRKKTAKTRSKSVKSTVKKTSVRKGTRRRRVGSKAALRDLAENTEFFASPRTIPDIQKHLENRRA